MGQETEGEAGLDLRHALPPCSPTGGKADSLRREEHEASIEEDQGEDDEEGVAHFPPGRVIEHLTGLGRAAEENRPQANGGDWEVGGKEGAVKGQGLLSRKRLHGPGLAESG